MNIFQCPHKFKSIVDMKITDYAKLANAFNADGSPVIITSGEYKVYRCQDCKCLVWDVA